MALPVLCVILLSVASCAPKELVRQPELAPYAGPVTVEVLKESVGFRDTKTIKALTDVRIFKNGEPAGSFSGVLGYQAPDFLKTSFFGPFGITIMEFLIAKDMLQVYVPPKDILYEMSSPGISFSSLTNEKFRFAMQEEGESYVLLAYDSIELAAEPVMKYLFDRTYLLNRQITVYKEGEKIITIYFDGFNGKVPEKTRISFINGMDMELTFVEPEYDTDIPSEYFREIGHADKKVLPFQDLLKRFDPKR
ncbi:MAG: hypothetical protein Q8K68_02065 [Nitrospirota bacterium]|nr:hypothetical protein [Nitrospirota bacterium]